ncbi:mitochondrial import receptor subunit TOM7 homolog [Rattus rattus]|uniref:mitochondrial import receptor subunit TOM7 homolog n=1 Tax=Rattus rattus TaxID=10117 RepID=UPI0013F3028E|nr:mitochondrial import receptor subunit TOM7 homolog [Rattus rattus]
MVKMSKAATQRPLQLFKGGQFAIRWGFISLVIYLGFTRGEDPGLPESSVLSLLWGIKDRLVIWQSNMEVTLNQAIQPGRRQGEAGHIPGPLHQLLLLALDDL